MAESIKITSSATPGGKKKRITVGTIPDSNAPDFLVDKGLTAPPEVTITSDGSFALDDLEATVMQIDHEWLRNVSNVNTFLYLWMKNFTHTLTEDFTCFGKVILSKGQTISPLDFLTIKLKPSRPSGIVSVTGDESRTNQNAIAFGLLSLYRYNKITVAQKEYRGIIKAKILGLLNLPVFENASFSLDSLISNAVQFNGFQDDVNYKRLLSAFDMFLEIAENSEIQHYRAATIVTRYEDCTMLGVMTSVSSSLSISTKRALMLCFHPVAAAEMTRMYEKESEEIIKKNSYLPYCRSMGLVMRSPYSVTVNKAFHAYYMSLLASIGDKRGRNALHVSDAPLSSVVEITIRLAYLLGESLELDKYITPTIENDVEDQEEESDDDDNDGLTDPQGNPLPTGQSATEKERDRTAREDIKWQNILFQKMHHVDAREAMRRARSHLSDDVRDNTIGKYVRNYAQGSNR